MWSTKVGGLLRHRQIIKFFYGYYYCCLLLSFLSMPLSNALTTSSSKSPAKPNTLKDNYALEGSGSFPNGAAVSKDGTEWQGSGLNPDDEPGDDSDDEHEGSGNIIEGSGIPIRPELPKMAEVTPTENLITTSTSIASQINKHLIYQLQTTTREPPFLSNLTSTVTVTPGASYITSRTTQGTLTTSTRNPVVVVNTRPSSQPEPSYILEVEPFEMLKPGILAAISGGAVVGVLMTILLVMFVVYRMRKKDEGSYSLDEPHQPSNFTYAYQKASTKEFYA